MSLKYTSQSKVISIDERGVWEKLQYSRNFKYCDQDSAAKLQQGFLCNQPEKRKLLLRMMIDVGCECAKCRQNDSYKRKSAMCLDKAHRLESEKKSQRKVKHCQSTGNGHTLQPKTKKTSINIDNGPVREYLTSTTHEDMLSESQHSDDTEESFEKVETKAHLKHKETDYQPVSTATEPSSSTSNEGSTHTASIDIKQPDDPEQQFSGPSNAAEAKFICENKQPVDKDILADEEWFQKSGDYTHIKRIPLANSDSEFKEVKRRFMESVTAERYSSKTGEMKRRVEEKDITVTKIERIENKYLYHRYKNRRDWMNSEGRWRMERHDKIPRMDVMERWLWQGTNPENLNSIVENGFVLFHMDPEKRVKNRKYGNGTYFAKHAHYSYKFAKQNEKDDNQCFLFYVQVLTGDFHGGSHSIMQPALMNENCSIKSCSRDSDSCIHTYDSCVNSIDFPKDLEARKDDDPKKAYYLDQHTQYVTYHYDQAYPKYIIFYKTDKPPTYTKETEQESQSESIKENHANENAKNSMIGRLRKFLERFRLYLGIH